MTQDQLKRRAIAIILCGNDCIEGLTEREAIEVFRFFFRNRALIQDAQFLLRNGFDYFHRGYPERAKEVINSGIIPSDIPIPFESDTNNAKPYKKRRGKVYLMRNNRNGFTKIGFSFTPKCREATLQSEEPELQILSYWDGNREGEGMLHRKFKAKRIRGEWFNLTEEDISEIGILGDQGELIA